jgi:hypothetical protein
MMKLLILKNLGHYTPEDISAKKLLASLQEEESEDSA